MAEYNPSKIIKDGNTYNFRDTTKIPLAGSNQISGSLIPSTNGTVNLGSASYQWNNAYIKSLTINGVACGDILTHNVSEFVNVSSDQTINGSKYFTSLLSKSNTLARGSLPTTNINEDPIFIAADKNNRRTLAFFNYYNTNGDGRVVLYAYNQNTTNYDNIGLVFGFNNANSSKFMYPVTTNTCDLGTSTNKWKTLNGIAPDELGLPTSTYTDVSSYITHFDSTPNDFTAPVSGLLFIEGISASVECVIGNYTKGYKINATYAYSTIRGLLPVEKGDSIAVLLSGQVTVNSARIYHLKGKV